MPLMTDREREFAQAISRLVYGNPFLPERIEAERQALGPGFVATGVVWHARAEPEDDSPNIEALNERVGALADNLRARLAGARASQRDLELYEDLVFYLLYNRYLSELKRFVATPKASTTRAAFAGHFAQDVAHYLGMPGAGGQAGHDSASLLALFFQIRRAFHFTFSHILGGSLPAARLRAAVWQSIFTHDLRRYRRGLQSHAGRPPPREPHDRRELRQPAGGRHVAHSRLHSNGWRRGGGSHAAARCGQRAHREIGRYLWGNCGEPGHRPSEADGREPGDQLQ